MSPEPWQIWRGLPPLTYEITYVIAAQAEPHSMHHPSNERITVTPLCHCHDRVENLFILFPTRCSIKPWHFRRYKCRLSRCTGDLGNSWPFQHPVLRAENRYLHSSNCIHQPIHRRLNILVTIRPTLSWTDSRKIMRHGSHWRYLSHGGRTASPRWCNNLLFHQDLLLG